MYDLTITEEVESVASPMCFPGDALVEVKSSGTVALGKLKIGDCVRTGADDFDLVYSFGHYDADGVGDSLRIHMTGMDRPLDISKAHMVFRSDDEQAVPASKLKIGDHLMTTKETSGGRIVSIQVMTRHRGVYAPFTMSGKIVVNDVVASSYISLIDHGTKIDEQGYKIFVGGFETPMTVQQLSHLAKTPHHLLCRLSWRMCEGECYDASGLSWWSAHELSIARWLLAHQTHIVSPSVGIAVVCLSFLLTWKLCRCVEKL